MVVNPSVPAKTVPEFITYAKANPGKVNMGRPATAPPHLAGELFKMMAGVDMVHVPYRGAAPALTDLLGGQVQVMFDALPGSIEYIRSRQAARACRDDGDAFAGAAGHPDRGRVRAGLRGERFFGLGAPKVRRAEIIDRLNTEINAGLADPKIKARLAELGGTELVLSPADFGKLIAEETEKWGQGDPRGQHQVL